MQGFYKDFELFCKQDSVRKKSHFRNVLQELHNRENLRKSKNTATQNPLEVSCSKNLQNKNIASFLSVVLSHHVLNFVLHRRKETRATFLLTASTKMSELHANTADVHLLKNEDFVKKQEMEYV